MHACVWGLLHRITCFWCSLLRPAETARVSFGEGLQKRRRKTSQVMDTGHLRSSYHTYALSGQGDVGAALRVPAKHPSGAAPTHEQMPYVHMCISISVSHHIYIYIYAEREREREREREGGRQIERCEGLPHCWRLIMELPRPRAAAARRPRPADRSRPPGRRGRSASARTAVIVCLQ